MRSRRLSAHVPIGIALAGMLTPLAPGMSAATVPEDTPTGSANSVPSENVRLLHRVWERVNEHFYDESFCGADWQAVKQRYTGPAYEAASKAALAEVINAMLAELHTSHTAFYTVEDREYHQLRDIFSEPDPLGHGDREVFRYEGIGIFSDEIDGRIFIAAVIDGTPAERAGLKRGDEIISVDGKPFETVGSFKGKAHTPVRMHIRRTVDPDDTRAISVVPEWIRPTEMFLEAIKHSTRVFRHDGARVGYVHVWSYAGAGNHDALKDGLTEEPLKDVDALVLDLRDGWGGAQADYLNLFNARLPVLTMQARDGPPRCLDRQWRKPVVLVVNERTRSGKEILAYGFRVYGIGTVVGSRTAGAVVGGRPFIMFDGSLLYLAVQDVRVDGRRLEGIGVEPDIVVPFDLRYSAGADPRLDRAIQVAAEQVQSS